MNPNLIVLNAFHRKRLKMDFFVAGKDTNVSSMAINSRGPHQGESL